MVFNPFIPIWIFISAFFSDLRTVTPGHHWPAFGPGTNFMKDTVQFSSVQSLSSVQLFATPWIAASQASLSITTSRSSPRLMSIESVMPSSHLILCRPLLLLPQIPPSIRVFFNESTLHMRWPKYWSFSFSISPSKNTQDWSPLEWTGWISLQSKASWKREWLDNKGACNPCHLKKRWRKWRFLYGK